MDERHSYEQRPSGLTRLKAGADPRRAVGQGAADSAFIRGWQNALASPSRAGIIERIVMV
jgi:hypothetical protein